MYDFLEKLINVTLPRVRDFHGISRKSFDKAGNYSLGFREHLAFPEIRSDEIETIHGVQITIHTTAKNKAEGLQLLEAFGFPFTKEKEGKK
jgi:large subunit ribosomal protein L5